jgi:DUF971 family protein
VFGGRPEALFPNTEHRTPKTEHLGMTPTNLRVIRAERVLEIDWPDGRRSRYPFRLLRQECPCAACVDEFTGIRKLDPESVPEGIVPEDVGMTGNYALRVRWTDGHDTGLFTWDKLRQLRDHTGVETTPNEASGGR